MMDKATITSGEMRLHGENVGFPQLKAVFGPGPLRAALSDESCECPQWTCCHGKRASSIEKLEFCHSDPEVNGCKAGCMKSG